MLLATVAGAADKPNVVIILAEDPHETRNLYADHPDRVAELSKLLDQYPLVTE